MFQLSSVSLKMESESIFCIHFMDFMNYFGRLEPDAYGELESNQMINVSLSER